MKSYSGITIFVLTTCILIFYVPVYANEQMNKPSELTKEIEPSVKIVFKDTTIVFSLPDPTIKIEIPDSFLGSNFWPESGLDVNLISPPPPSFWDKHLGTLMGALIGAVVAIFAVLLSDRKSRGAQKSIEKSRRKEESKKERNLHRNILAGISTELVLHKRMMDSYLAKWNKFEHHHLAIKPKHLKSLHFSLPVEFISWLRRRLTEVENIKDLDIILLSEYIDKCSTLNNHLSLNLIDDTNLFIAESPNNFDLFRNDLVDKIKSHKADYQKLVRAIKKYATAYAG